ncbi:hypothetical protein FACS1894152_3440 [Bacilli bacterium]|nr:hypothetical protein FACS1894152_3440 [Bacilli bacterium]
MGSPKNKETTENEENKVVETYAGKPSTRKRRGTNRRGGVGRGEENKETAEDKTENKNNEPKTDL